MTTPAAAPAPDVKPGVIPAWAVRFSADPPQAGSPKPVTVGSDAYDGSVTATLPRELAGGSYQMVIEGMTDADYAKLLGLARGPLRATLHLWWKDSSPSVLGDLARFSGLADPLGPTTPDPPEYSLVADLRVDKVRRRAGERRYEVTVTGRERVQAKLEEARVAGACYVSLEAAVQAVADTAGLELVTHQLETARPRPDQPDFANTSPGKASDAMNTLAGQVRDAVGLYGLPVTMIRDGTLHIGRWTGTGGVGGVGVSRRLNEGSGLVSVERGEELKRDERLGDPPRGTPASRGTVVVTALGRPDLKPGDTLEVALPPDDFPVLEPPSDGAALLTALTGLPAGDTGPDVEPSDCLVTEVSHRISRRQGFVTTVHATVLKTFDDGWDQPQATTPPASGEPAQPHGTASADPAAGAASAVHALVRHSIASRADPVQPRIGQIHDHPAEGVPRHTSVVRYSNAAPDGLPMAAQRTIVGEHADHEIRDVPYLTPFGWGHYGLVLPRYPGTRVLLGYAGGGPGDLIDLGSVWERGGGPPAKAGDYWLVLPVGLVQREHMTDGDGTAPDRRATHDLIDADGTRLIETTRFVIRVTDDPTACTSRPDSDAEEGSVLIQTKPSSGGGASIELKDDGSVTVTASSITLDTAGQGDITLKANNVKVQVSGTMDVS